MAQATQRRENRVRDRLLAALQEDLSEIRRPELVEMPDGALAALPVEELQETYGRSAGHFVQQWDRLLAGWLAEIERRARILRAEPAAASEATRPMPAAKDADGPGPMELAVLPILQKANRLLKTLGRKSALAEALVGPRTRELLTHECCKAIAGEADPRLYDLVYSRLHTVMQSVRTGSTRHAAGQRARARHRRQVAAAFEPGAKRAEAPAVRRTVAPATPPALGGSIPRAGKPVAEQIAAAQRALALCPRTLTRALFLGVPDEVAAEVHQVFEDNHLGAYSAPLHEDAAALIAGYGFGLIVLHPDGTAASETAVARIAEAISASSVNRDLAIVVAGDGAEAADRAAKELRRRGLRPSGRPLPARSRVGWIAELMELVEEEFKASLLGRVRPEEP
jgi:hypothetical protein